MKMKNKWSAALGILFLVGILFLGASGVQAKATRLEMELTHTFESTPIIELGEMWMSDGIQHVRDRSFTYAVYNGTFVTSDGQTGTYNWGGFSYTMNWNLNTKTGKAQAWGTWVIPELTLTFDESGELWSGSFEGTMTNKINFQTGFFSGQTPGHGTGGDFEGMHYKGFRSGYFGAPLIQDTMIIFDPHGRIGT
ncbi:MAG: hypothetical protein ACFFBD_09690 [Candidatus Hodarchaeota archaeon]